MARDFVAYGGPCLCRYFQWPSSTSNAFATAWALTLLSHRRPINMHHFMGRHLTMSIIAETLLSLFSSTSLSKNFDSYHISQFCFILTKWLKNNGGHLSDVLSLCHGFFPNLWWLILDAHGKPWLSQCIQLFASRRIQRETLAKGQWACFHSRFPLTATILI